MIEMPPDTAITASGFSIPPSRWRGRGVVRFITLPNREGRQSACIRWRPSETSQHSAPLSHHCIHETILRRLRLLFRRSDHPAIASLWRCAGPRFGARRLLQLEVRRIFSTSRRCPGFRAGRRDRDFAIGARTADSLMDWPRRAPVWQAIPGSTQRLSVQTCCLHTAMDGHFSSVGPSCDQ